MKQRPGIVSTEQTTTLEIADGARVLRFDYRQALDFHEGNSYWGCALAFRMLQRAGALLSRERLWDRNRLRIISGHPGPGVRDTLELVTGCVSQDRFSLFGGPRAARCVGDMEYRWRLNDGAHELNLELAEGIVPAEFLQLLHKINQVPANEEDKSRLEDFKRSMTESIWQMSLERAFPEGDLEMKTL